MKALTVIFSFNTPRRTHRCYNELLLRNPSWSELLVLDNSSRKNVAWTPHTVWVGDDNLGHGGMIDWVLHHDIEKYDFVGMINNDTFDYTPGFVGQLLSHAGHDTGIISPSIKPGGSIWPTMLRDRRAVARPHNFIETIAPWYSRPLLREMRKLMPYEYFGQIDRAVSIVSCRLGLQNLIVNSMPITHEAGIGRTELGTVTDYHKRWRQSVKAWYDAHPEIAGLEDVWPDQINSTSW